MSFDDSTRESNLSGKFMIDTVRLQELQDVYAQVANLFIFCVDWLVIKSIFFSFSKLKKYTKLNKNGGVLYKTRIANKWSN